MKRGGCHIKQWWANIMMIMTCTCSWLVHNDKARWKLPCSTSSQLSKTYLVHLVNTCNYVYAMNVPVPLTQIHFLMCEANMQYRVDQQPSLRSKLLIWNGCCMSQADWYCRNLIYCCCIYELDDDKVGKGGKETCALCSGWYCILTETWIMQDTLCLL